MNNKNLETVAKLLGVSYDSLTQFPVDVQNSMTTVMEMFDIQTEDDASAAFDELHEIWKKAVINADIAEIAQNTGILSGAIQNLPERIKAQIIFEYYMTDDGSKVYEMIQTALATVDLPDVAELLGKPVSELEQLPVSIQTQLCGMYSMEHGITEDTELIESLNEILYLAE